MLKSFMPIKSVLHKATRDNNLLLDACWNQM